MHLKGVGVWPGFNWLTTETDGKAMYLRAPYQAENILITCSAVHLEDLGIDVRKLLKRIFKQLDGEAWNGLLVRISGGRL
jgi:hypothetical protein